MNDLYWEELITAILMAPHLGFTDDEFTTATRIMSHVRYDPGWYDAMLGLGTIMHRMLLAWERYEYLNEH